MLVVMVAEKPSLAQSISKILSNNHYESRKGFNGACNVFEWNGKFQNSSCKFKMTSVCGHVMSLDFTSKYNNWDRIDPSELFKGETLKKEANPKLNMPSFLEKECRGADYLVLWLDCDKEGENICFEVIDSVRRVMNRPNDESREETCAITDTDIKRAMNNLGKPNKNESLSVDARQELDLRIGCAFTRFQTRFFQGKYGDLDSNLVSYGPCQTPTLFLCVEREDKIKSHKPETFWYLEPELQDSKSGKSFSVKWSRVHLFDKEVVYLFYNEIRNASKALVTKVQLQSKRKERPAALNTVELLRAASKGLGISPIQTMQIAERLYTQGYISYPRTETTQYPALFDFRSVLNDQKNSPAYGEHVKRLLDGEMQISKKGVDQGDHPPITPTSYATYEELGGEAWRVYDFVTRYFIATLSPDAKYEELTITVKIQDEEFTSSGKNTISNGWTDLMPWKQIDTKEMPSLREGDTLQIGSIKVQERQTSPPDYLSESELIGLMEKHGIGTDASIPVHVNNICERNYVKLERDRRLVPTNLGIVLVHGYLRIDPDLCFPKMRSQIETQLNLIATGKANYQLVLQHALKIFEQKFHFFVQNIPMMDTLFEDTFSALSALGKPMSRCGKCRRFMKLVSTKPQRLYCENCKDTYNLPQNGVIKLYRELKCPLDDFELLVNSVSKNRNYPFCPYCHNNPPFPDMASKSSTCIDCSHPSCAYSYIANGVTQCFECENGLLVLDSTTPPKYRIVCNKCNVILILPDVIYKLEVTDESCDSCETTLLKINYNKKDTPLENGETVCSACLFCDSMLKGTIEKYMQLQNKRMDPSFRGRGGRGGRGRGRGKGRGGRGRGAARRTREW